jgi:hypothetical protein
MQFPSVQENSVSLQASEEISYGKYVEVDLNAASNLEHKLFECFGRRFIVRFK